MKISSGKYKLKADREYRMSMFLKLFGRELILIVCISLLIFIELFAFFLLIPSEYIALVYISMMVVNLLLEFLVINTLLYNRKYTQNKKSDSFFLLIALIFINFNFIIPISYCFNDTEIIIDERTVYLFNIIIALSILGYVVYKLLYYKLLQKRDGNAKKPTILFYISSAFTLFFNGLSIASIIVYSAKTIYLLSIVFALMILHLTLVKSFIYNIRERSEKITKITRIIFIIIIIFFFTIIGVFISIIFGNTLYFYLSHTDYKIIISRFELFDLIWNISSLFYNIMFVTIGIIILIILELKYEIVFDWEGVPKNTFNIRDLL